MKKYFVIVLMLVFGLVYAQNAPKKATSKTTKTNTKLDKTKFKKLQGGTIQTDVKVPTGEAGIVKPRKKTKVNTGANKTAKEKLTKSNKLLY